MKKIIALFAFVLLVAGNLLSQVKGIVVEEVDNGGAVKGRTIRVYVVLENDSDQVYMVYGEKAHPLSIKSDKPFYQSPLNGPTSRTLNRKLSKEKPELGFDSWLTIGSEDNYDNNTEALINTDAFEKTGDDLTTSDGAWYCLPNSKQSYAGADKQVLIMQLTSEGNMEGNFCLMGRNKKGENFHYYNGAFTFKQSSK